MSEGTYLHTFISTHCLMEAESRFLQQHIDYRLIPTPRKISSECGFSIVSGTILSTAEGLEHIYSITQEGRNKDYEEIR